MDADDFEIVDSVHLPRAASQPMAIPSMQTLIQFDTPIGSPMPMAPPTSTPNNESDLSDSQVLVDMSDLVSALTESIETTPLHEMRKCFISGLNMNEADLGICLSIKPKKFGTGKPDIDLLEDSYVSRVEFNAGIRAMESGTRGFILKTPSNQIATHWFPLTLKKEEHWMRTSGPNGTKRIKNSNQSKSKSSNYFFALDNSGSMGGEFNRQCLKSIEDMVRNTVKDSDVTSLVTFSDVYNICFTALNKRDHMDKITAYIANQNHPSGQTHFYRSLFRILSEADFSRPMVLVALTDGADNDAKGSDQHALLCVLLDNLRTQKRNLRLLIITVGTLPNKNQIEKLVSLAPEGHLITAAQSGVGIKEAYDKARKIIVSSSGQGDEDVVGTQDLLMSAISLIVSGENGHFVPENIWSVSAKLLNLAVVSFAKGTRPVNSHTLRNYCDIHRTLIEMLRDYPLIKMDLIRNIRDFMDKSCPNNRRRELIPDIGEAIQLLALVDEIRLEDFIEVYLQEMFRRRAIQVNFLGDNTTKSALEQLKFYWDQYKSSILCGAFNVLFLREMIHGSVTRACEQYDATLQYLSDDAILEFQGKYNYVRDMDNFETVMNYLGVSSNPDDILALIYYGKTHKLEPEQPQGGSLIRPSNNIRTTNVALAPIKLDAVDYKSYVAKTPIKPTKAAKIAHVGWSIKHDTLTEQDKLKLLNMCAQSSKQLKPDFYTTIMFNDDQQLMVAKALEVDSVQVVALINGYYYDTDGTVADMTIDSSHYYVVMTESNVPPAKMKMRASNGQMGDMVPIVPLRLPCCGKVHYK
jgi:Mg-chelatase subunit ChlD